MEAEECHCKKGYSGEFCEIEDKCITQETNCKNYPCLDGKCLCEGFYFGESCKQYIPNTLIDIFDVVHLDINESPCHLRKPKCFYIKGQVIDERKFVGSFNYCHYTYDDDIGDYGYVFCSLNEQVSPQDSLKIRIAAGAISNCIELSATLIGDTITGSGKLFNDDDRYGEWCVEQIKSFTAVRRK